jgi:uncharacterized membrane protein YgcG
MVADSNDHISKVLDHCVQQIEQGMATTEDCLARYPAHRTELAELLPLALNLRRAPRIELPTDVVRAGRGLLLESLPPRPLPPRRSLLSGFRPGTHSYRKARRFTMAWALVIAAVVSLAAGGGVAYAADAAVPGDPLYGVDLAMEQVRLNLTNDPEAIFDYQLNRADERIGEAKKLAAAGDTENLSQALTGYSEAFAGAAKQAGRLAEHGQGNGVQMRLEDAVASHNEDIGNLTPGTPAGVQVTLQDRDSYCSVDDLGNVVVVSTHSVADSLAADDGYSAEQITQWFCDGFGLGEIMHAMSISEALDGQLTVQQLLDLRAGNTEDGSITTGWGTIMRDYGLVGNPLSPGGSGDPGKPDEPGTAGSGGRSDDPGKTEDDGAWKEDPMGPGEANQNGAGNSNQPDAPGKPEGAGSSGDSPGNEGGNGSRGNGGSGSGSQGGVGSSTVLTPTNGVEAPGQGGAGAGGGKGN